MGLTGDAANRRITVGPDPLPLLRPLLPARVAAISGPVTATDLDALLPEERAAIARAVPARQAEFASGRRCAHRALAELGCALTPIPMAADRSPIWPRGIVGSITHDGGWCIAVAARAAEVGSLGIDLATIGDFRPEIGRAICTPGETVRLAPAGPDRLRPADLATVFAIKEAFYKAQHPVTGAWLGFEDVEVRFDLDGPGTGACVVDLLKPAGAYSTGTRFGGRWATDGLRCVAVLTVTSPERSPRR